MTDVTARKVPSMSGAVGLLAMIIALVALAWYVNTGGGGPRPADDPCLQSDYAQFVCARDRTDMLRMQERHDHQK